MLCIWKVIRRMATNELKYKNRQNRIWCPVLYPLDNDKHERACLIASAMDNSILMDHEQLTDPEDGSIVTKAHTHLILSFDKPYWLSVLLKDLMLNDEDAHLFVNIKQICEHENAKFKNKDDYIIYLTHIYSSDKDYHYPKEFYGTDRDYAIEVCSRINKSNYDLFIDLQSCIHEIMKDEVDCRSWFIYQWADEIIKRGYGEALNKHWAKFRDIVKDYIFY